MATPQEPQQPQRFVERRQPEGSPPSETPSELVVWQARQRFALTLGAILLLLLLVGGGMALLLLREWRTSLVQAPPPPKPSRQFLQAPPSWKPVTFRRRTYYFPFRLYLKPVREFCEPLVRPEFAYVAEI